MAGTHKERLWLLDAESMVATWQADLSTFSSVIDSWNEIRPLGRHRWLYADRARCLLADTRASSTEGGHLLLLSSLRSLPTTAQICHLGACIDTHLVPIFTDTDGLLMDVRMPGRTLSQFTVPLMSPVSYSTSLETDRPSRAVCVLGCQLGARHCIYDVRLPSATKSASLGSQQPPRPARMSLGLALLQTAATKFSLLTACEDGGVLLHRYRLRGGATDHNNNNNNNNNYDGSLIVTACGDVLEEMRRSSMRQAEGPVSIDDHDNEDFMMMWDDSDVRDADDDEEAPLLPSQQQPQEEARARDQLTIDRYMASFLGREAAFKNEDPFDLL